MALAMRLGRETVDVDLQPADRLPQGSDAVVGVVDRVVFLQAHQRRIFAQQPGTEAVEGAHPDGRIAGQPLDPASHLVGGLVGEGQGEDLVGRGLPGETSQATRWVTTRVLPLPGPARIKQRPLEMGDRLALGFR